MKLKFFLNNFFIRGMQTKIQTIYKCAYEDLSIILIDNHFWKNWGLM